MDLRWCQLELLVHLLQVADQDDMSSLLLHYIHNISIQAILLTSVIKKIVI